MTWLDFDWGTFRTNYNWRPFQFAHRLAQHPLMDLAELKALTLRMPPRDILHRAGVVPVGADFDHVASQNPNGLTIADTVNRLVETRSSITINTPEKDPKYRPLINEILDEIRFFTDDLDSPMTYTAAYFFIAAPGSITPYHMDREMNFLIHLRGPKVMRLWDPSVLGEQERDVLFKRRDLARPSYRTELEAQAMVYDLAAGTGVHHPFIAPHWAKTGEDLSISLAVTFRTERSDRITRLHTINHALRRIGLRPKPVGLSEARDELKWSLFKRGEPALRKLKPLLRRQHAPG